MKSLERYKLHFFSNHIFVLLCDGSVAIDFWCSSFTPNLCYVVSEMTTDMSYRKIRPTGARKRRGNFYIVRSNERSLRLCTKETESQARVCSCRTNLRFQFAASLRVYVSLARAARCTFSTYHRVYGGGRRRHTL